MLKTREKRLLGAVHPTHDNTSLPRPTSASPAFVCRMDISVGPSNVNCEPPRSDCTTSYASNLILAQKRKQHAASKAPLAGDRDAEVRIIGGQFRGRRLHYHGDPVVRPMKHRTREAIFNLISTGCQGRHAIDLFAGTGALGLEAISRGCPSATFIEKHVPTARIVEENIRILGVEDRTTLIITSAFLWAKRDLPNTASIGQTYMTVREGHDAQTERPERYDDDVRTDEYVRPTLPWLVFCSPPYVFFRDRLDEMLDLITRVRRFAPPDSLLVVEAEEPFNFDVLRQTADSDQNDEGWDIRTYLPAIVGIWHKAIITLDA